MNAQKKSIIYIFAILCALAVISGTIILILEFNNPDGTKTGTDYILFEPDYELNIFNDAEYLELNRSLSYKDGAITSTYSLEDDLSLIDPVLGFFASYLKCIINGEYNEYQSFFDEKYPGKYTLPIKFTMQMLYNMSLEKLSQASEDGSTIYKLDYLIRKNNGTFRPEIGSDGCKSQYISLKKNGDSYLITKIYTLNIITEVVS